MSRIDQVIIRVQVAWNCERTVEVVAATDKVRQDDLNEIVEWFIGNNSRAYIQFDRENIFFHPLPYGDFAFGVIDPLSDDVCSNLGQLGYSFVRVLIISPSVLLAQANNPIAIYERLFCNKESGIKNITKSPDKLSPLEVPVLQSVCDTDILRKVVSAAGAVAISRLFQSLLDSVSTIFRPCKSVSSLFILSGLFNLLPVRFRSGLTFSTALFLSSINPLQAVGFDGDGKRAIKLAKKSGVSLVDFERFSNYPQPPQNLCLGRWSQLVLRVLSNGDFAFWEYQIRADAESDNEPEEFTDWQELNDLAIMWQCKYPKSPITYGACSCKTGELAEKGLEQSITAVEMLLADTKRKPAG
ncbi:MAG: hypothetical protein LBC74_10820 [Planctomycetaceae bacterium]|jgi:hypothetical protein|nr:hypothetical protein [Planctomycetaceae bacterium]